MSINPLMPRQVKLSNLRPKNKKNIKKWVNDNTQVMPEPQDGYLPENERLDSIKNDYLNKLKDKKSAWSNNPPQNSMTTQEFLSKDKAIVTDEILKFDNDNSNITIGSNKPSITDDIKKNMNLKTQSVKGSEGDNQKTASIGSFNIEWLGTKNRSQEDYKQIAQVIKDSKASLLGIEEISSLQGLQNVLKHLPNYGYVLGKSGDQMVGAIFDKDRVTYDANSIEQLEDVTLGNPGLRPPLSFDAKVDNFDFNFTVLHLKAGMNERSKGIRDKQAIILNKWIKNRMESKPDKDYIVVGDYNDFPSSSTLKKLDEGNIFDYASDEGPQKGIYSNIKYKSLIDHGALSRIEGGAHEEYVSGSLRTVNEKDYNNYLGNISDHKPIVFDVKTNIDND